MVMRASYYTGQFPAVASCVVHYDQKVFFYNCASFRQIQIGYGTFKQRVASNLGELQK